MGIILVKRKRYYISYKKELNLDSIISHHASRRQQHLLSRPKKGLTVDRASVSPMVELDGDGTEGKGNNTEKQPMYIPSMRADMYAFACHVRLPHLPAGHPPLHFFFLRTVER
ncbi:hypothetical protein VTH06DRAFT_7932 [Thermothelomyces fergusii]